jgi:hypothetical protein
MVLQKKFSVTVRYLYAYFEFRNRKCNCLSQNSSGSVLKTTGAVWKERSWETSATLWCELTVSES